MADYAAALRIDPTSAIAYRTRGVTLFALGRFVESAADLKRTTELRPSDVYANLWLHITRLRSGSSDDDFGDRSASFDATKWPGPVLRLYVGQNTPDQVLSAASDSNERCEASFYVAEWELWRHEITLAEIGLKQAVMTCPHSYLEYEGARAELTRLPK
jgi:lipoprotein NlpI